MTTKTFIKATVYSMAMHYKSWPRQVLGALGTAMFACARAAATVAGAVTAPVAVPVTVLFCKRVDAARVDEAWAKLWHGCRSCGRSGYRDGRRCPRCGWKGSI